MYRLHAKMFPRRNSKKVTAFTRTKYSELQKLKLEKDKFPVKVYSEKLLEAVEKNLDDRRQNVAMMGSAVTVPTVAMTLIRH